MELSELLQAYGKAHASDECVLDEHGACRLVFGGSTAVDIERSTESEVPEIALFFSTAGPLPGDATPALLKHMLGANLFATASLGATVALREETSEVILVGRHETTSMDTESFSAALDEFVDQVERWRTVLEKGMTEEDIPNEATPPDSAIRA